MFGLFVLSLIITCMQLIKESLEKPIPVENWGNKELYYKDVMNGIPIEERMKNLKNGKYILKEKYSEPRRDERGRIIIENSFLYEEDAIKYDAYQAKKWAEQGKYNLPIEEPKKENGRL